jgi:FkbM family methyltransferase
MRSRLIYDVGMHRGEDTDYYLRRGHRVIGVEANPKLVVELRARFRSEIEAGQLRIIDKAINRQPGVARFAINEVTSVWGTLDSEFVARNEASGAPSTFIEVECLTFDEVLREHGMPYYLKVDIEGCDLLCIEALRGFDVKPRYVSVESRVTSPQNRIRDAVAEIRLLHRLGYRKFKYVNQAIIPNATYDLSLEGEPITFAFPDDSSGPFGAETRGKWHAFGVAVATGMMLRLTDDICGPGGRLNGLPGAGVVRQARRRLAWHSSPWYDLHAATG